MWANAWIASIIKNKFLTTYNFKEINTRSKWARRELAYMKQGLRKPSTRPTFRRQRIGLLANSFQPSITARVYDRYSIVIDMWVTMTGELSILCHTFIRYLRILTVKSLVLLSNAINSHPISSHRLINSIYIYNWQPNHIFDILQFVVFAI